MLVLTYLIAVALYQTQITILVDVVAAMQYRWPKSLSQDFDDKSGSAASMSSRAALIRNSAASHSRGAAQYENKYFIRRIIAAFGTQTASLAEINTCLTLPQTAQSATRQYTNVSIATREAKWLKTKHTTSHRLIYQCEEGLAVEHDDEGIDIESVMLQRNI